MGLIRKTLFTAITATAVGVGYLGQATTLVRPLPPRDPIFSSKVYKRYNAHKNPLVQDVCLKRVPINKVNPALLERDGDLVLEFCRGVWTSLGYEPQRRILSQKYQNDSTATDLWTREQLAESTYEPGTIITDHFEVVEKTPTSITVRCGDSPRNKGPRDSDGLFVFTAYADRDRGLVELGLKSVFFNSARKLEGVEARPPVGFLMEELHTWYSRLWMVTGYRRLLK